MSVKILSFRKYEKNTLLAFVTLLLPSVGLEIRDCTLHFKDGKRWVNLPSRPYHDKETGDLKYSYVCAFPDKKFYEAFQKQALTAIDQYLSHHVQTREISDDDIPF